MKKLSLVLLIMLAAIWTIAQTNIASEESYGSNIQSVVQDGSGNEATISSGSVTTPVTNNHQPAYLGDWIEGSFINQNGVKNMAITVVRTSDNSTAIDQIGNNNTAKQDLGSFDELTTSYTLMGLDIYQEGNENWATQKTIQSFGTYGIQGMSIYQYGKNNVADQASIGGMGQIQKINQVGDNNNNPKVSLNTYDISSINLIFPPVQMLDPLALPYTFANGYGNGVSLPLTQYSNQNHGKAIISVTGDNNNTFQFQEYTVWGTSGDNEAEMDIVGSTNDVAQGQLGESNKSTIDLDGSGNVVASTQWGGNNQADFYINGLNNIAGIQQEGNGNIGSISAVGNANSQRIIQHP